MKGIVIEPVHSPSNLSRIGHSEDLKTSRELFGEGLRTQGRRNVKFRYVGRSIISLKQTVKIPIRSFIGYSPIACHDHPYSFVADDCGPIPLFPLGHRPVFARLTWNSRIGIANSRPRHCNDNVLELQ